MGRKTLGERLLEARQARNLTLKELSRKIVAKHRGNTMQTTIRQIETGVTSNPGIKTLEIIAEGLGLPPLEVMSWALDDPPPEKKQRFSESHFAAVSEVYEALPPARKIFWDEVLEMVIEQMRKG